MQQLVEGTQLTLSRNTCEAPMLFQRAGHSPCSFVEYLACINPQSALHTCTTLRMLLVLCIAACLSAGCCLPQRHCHGWRGSAWPAGSIQPPWLGRRLDFPEFFFLGLMVRRWRQQGDTATAGWEKQQLFGFLRTACSGAEQQRCYSFSGSTLATLFLLTSVDDHAWCPPRDPHTYTCLHIVCDLQCQSSRALLPATARYLCLPAGTPTSCWCTCMVGATVQHLGSSGGDTADSLLHQAGGSEVSMAGASAHACHQGLCVGGCRGLSGDELLTLIAAALPFLVALHQSHISTK